ncbi:MAG: methylated-DNA--[protein]-cysteine S-methyltransferase [Eubacteriales bacterium]
MQMDYAVYEMEIGKICIRYSKDVVLSIKKINTESHDEGTKTELTEKVYSQLLEYFAGNRKVFKFAYNLKGTEFQKRVWNALCDIPYGETRTYKEIACAIGNEKACRAVGMANNKNPISIVVPCHRVIGANGKLVGYAGGLEMKERLLNLERKNK